MPTASPRTLGAVLFPGFELLDLYGPLEMFGCLGTDLRIQTVAEETGPVPSSAGPATVAEHAFATAPDFDLILIPGGFGVFEAQENPAVLDFLKRAHGPSEVMLSVCNGAALLTQAGLLNGRRATTNKIFFQTVEGLNNQVDWVHEARWVRDGDIVTASGVSAGTDMALAVIAEMFGDARAEAVAIVTEYQWERDSGKDPFAQHLNDMSWVAKATGSKA